MYQYLKEIFLVFLLLLSGVSYAQQNIILTKDSSYCPLGRRVEILEDASKNLVLRDLLLPKYQANFKLSMKDAPFHGYSLSNYWFRFKVETHALPFNTEWFIQLHNPNIDTVEVYFLNEKNELIQQYQTGDLFPFMQRPVTYHKFLFPLPFEKADKISVYICLKGNYAKNHNLDLVEKKTLLNVGQTAVSFYIFLKAILVALLLYNFLLFLSIRDIAYLYYVGYLFFSLLYFLAFDGFALRILYPQTPFLTAYVVNIAAVYAIVFLLWFTYNFLHIQKIFGVSSLKIIWTVTTIGHILIILNLANVHQLYGIPLFSFFAFFVIICATLSLVMGLLALRQKRRQAIFFNIAITFLFTGILIGILRRLGVEIPESIGENSFQLGSVLECLLFSFALADRIKIANKEKRKAQLETIEALQKNEMMIREQNVLLESRVRERTAKIEEQKEEIQQQNFVLHERSEELQKVNASKDKLFAIIGHDLRSPINSLKSLMDLLLNQYISAEEFVSISQSLRNSVEYAHFTLNNVLEWARSQMQGEVINLTVCNLSKLVKENMNFLESVAKSKQMILKSYVNTDIEVFADENHLRTILRNLIANAIKFSYKNGEISINSTQSGEMQQIVVKDTGIGMTEEQIGKLFFTNTHFSTKGTAGEAGSGLGLVLVKDLVEKNGGKIWVESEKDKGSTFYFTLPTK